MVWDLLVKGGLVVDPSQGLHAVCDVGITGGKIAAVGEGLDAGEARRVIEAKERLVTAGFVDIHVHTFASQGKPPSVSADPTCLAKGVTTILDAGTAAPSEFPLFYESDIRRDRVRTLALVRMPDPWGPTPASVDETFRTIRQYDDVLVGVKFHHSQHYPSLVLAREAADFAGGLLMAEAYGPPLPHLLEYLKPGDVLTHTFHPSFRTPLFDHRGKVLPAVWDAVERGVYLDVGHGSRGFGWRTMEQVLEQGLRPHTISTDLHEGCVDGPVFDMPTTMSKFLALGLSLDDVVEMSTVVPAKVLRREGEIGTLRPGSAADVTVSRLEDGEFEFLDVLHEARRGRMHIVPEVVIAGGAVYEGPAYQPKAMTHQVTAPPGFVIS
jgi:dihydroorotase